MTLKHGIYEICIRRPWAVGPEQCKGTIKGLRVINFIVSCVLKSNILDHRRVFVLFAAAVTAKHHENVMVVGNNNNLLYLMGTGSQYYG